MKIEQNSFAMRVGRAWMVAIFGAWMLFTPTTAFASGGWEGFGLVLSLMAWPVLIIALLVLGLVFLRSTSLNARRITGVVGLIVGGLCVLWQGFWMVLDIHHFNRLPNPLLIGSLLVLSGVASAIILYLAWRLALHPAPTQTPAPAQTPSSTA